MLSNLRNWEKYVIRVLQQFVKLFRCQDTRLFIAVIFYGCGTLAFLGIGANLWMSMMEKVRAVS